MAFFLEFRVFISPLLVSTLEEIHSPKKVLLNKRVKKKKEMILSVSSQCANLEHFSHFMSPTPRSQTHIHKRSQRSWTNSNLTESKGEGIQLSIQEGLCPGPEQEDHFSAAGVLAIK